jgi:chromosome partitioning protein
MARIVAVANPRTGSGKTTTVAGLAMQFVELGQSVLVVDLDPQASLTTRFGIDAEQLDASVYDVIMLGTRAIDVMVDTETHVDVLPAALELSGVETALVTRSGRETLVREALRSIRDDYDWIVVDCASSLGILAQNGLSMADDLIIPMDEYSERATAQLLEAVVEIRRFVNPDLRIFGVLPTNADTVTARTIANAVRDAHGLEVLAPIPHGARANAAYRELAASLLRD